jgi:hypothetical protein
VYMVIVVWSYYYFFSRLTNSYWIRSTHRIRRRSCTGSGRTSIWEPPRGTTHICAAPGSTRHAGSSATTSTSALAPVAVAALSWVVTRDLASTRAQPPHEWGPPVEPHAVRASLTVRSCLGTKFLKITVFEILQYILVMTIPHFTIPQF